MLYSIGYIKQKYGYIVRGAIHLGAHIGQEAEEYASAKKVLWIEGNPDILPELRANIAKYPGQVAEIALVSDKDEEDVDFNVTSNGQSSSIFELDKMKTVFPDIGVVEKKHLKTVRLDTLFRRKNFSKNDYDFLAVDVQGAEIKAMKGMGEILESIEWICVEVNLVTFYTETPLLHTIDSFLMDKGFIRTEMNLKPRQWGDALYRRAKITKCDKRKMLLRDFLLEAKIGFLFKFRFLRKWWNFAKSKIQK